MAAADDKDIRHLEKRIEELEKLMNAKFVSQQQAVEKANAAMEARFESVNEFRATLSDQTRGFITSAVYHTAHQDVTRRVGNLETKVAGYDGRIIGTSAGIGAIVLVITIVAQLLDLGG